MPHNEEWRILADEAAHEQDPKKLMEIVNSLNAAIDAQLTKKTTPPIATLIERAKATQAVSPAKSPPPMQGSGTTGR